MLKNLIIFVACLLLNINAELNETVVSTTTMLMTTTGAAAAAAATEAEKVEPFVNTDIANNSLTPLVKNSNAAANFAIGKLLVNHTNPENGHVVSKPTSGCGVNCGLSLTLILVLVFVITAIIAVILTALFVMRRRFSTWRLNGGSGKSNGLNEVGNGVLTNTSSSENSSTIDNKCITTETNEKKEMLKDGDEKKETANNLSSSCLTSVENKQALMGIGAGQVTDNGHSNEAAELNNLAVEAKNDNGDDDQKNKQQASPSSSSPLIDTNDESSKLITSMQTNPDTTPTQQQQQQPAQTTQLQLNEQTTTSSSSSLIVNVLNELSESVASKLASKSPSASKLAPTNAKTDPEKQPLNNE